MLFLTGLLLTTLALYFFAASQTKHASTLFKAIPPAQKYVAYRLLAWATIIASTVFCILVFGIGVGLVKLCAWLFVGGWGIALWLSWRKRSR